MVEIKFCIEYPFEDDFIENKFQKFFDLLISYIKCSDYESLFGDYELELLDSLRYAFKHADFLED